jgi:hypothetical protein
MTREQSLQQSLAQLHEASDSFGGEREYTNREELATPSGETFYMNLRLRCQRNDEKQISYAKVWCTESDGSTPFEPGSLYLGVQARSYVLNRNIGVSQLEVTLLDDIEGDQVGYVVRAAATAYDEASNSIGEVSDSLDDCATP